MFGAESGKGSQTGWIPDMIPPGMALRATGWARVATVTDNRAAQVRYMKTHVHNTRRIGLPRTEVSLLCTVLQWSARPLLPGTLSPTHRRTLQFALKASTP